MKEKADSLLRIVLSSALTVFWAFICIRVRKLTEVYGLDIVIKLLVMGGLIAVLCLAVSDYRYYSVRHNSFVSYRRGDPSEAEQLRTLDFDTVEAEFSVRNESFAELAEDYNDDPQLYDFLVWLTAFAGVCARNDYEEWQSFLSAGANAREFTVKSLKAFGLHPEAIRFEKLCADYSGDTFPFREYFGAKADTLCDAVVNLVRKNIREFDI